MEPKGLTQLGLVGAEQEQGERYQLFRDAIRRLAGVVYENDHFYDPVRGEHREVAFGLLKYSLPLDDTSSRAWHFVLDTQWFRFCAALAGSVPFDFATDRPLDFAARRLFLPLSKIFWRNDHPPAFERGNLESTRPGAYGWRNLPRAVINETFECSHVSPERGRFERPPRTLARCGYVSLRAARGIEQGPSIKTQPAFDGRFHGRHLCRIHGAELSQALS